MTDYVTELAALCAELNPTVESCRRKGDIPLREFIDIQAGKVKANRSIRPLRGPEDFFSNTADSARRNLGEDAAREVYEAVSHGVISTSDHHGSLFNSQTFQGDLIFGEILRSLGHAGRHVPIHSGSQVELGNVTYARGFCAYQTADSKQLIPLFPSKERSRLVSHTDPVTPEMVDAFCRHVDETDGYGEVADTVKAMCRELWGSVPVPASGRYADQTTAAGVRLSSLIFSGDDGPLLTYVELEEAARPILEEEIRDKDSLIAQLLFDREKRSLMQEIKTEGGVPLAGLLFRNADERGRKSLLTLTEDGELTGTGWHKEELRYSADAESLCRLLEERRIFPGLFLIAFAIAFERGVSWMGGMFQTLYLPEWQSCLVRLLSECGYRSESENFASYDCSGYICGPMYAHYEGDVFSVCAGPLEFYLKRPEWGRVREMMSGTRLWDSHVIGLTEMYNDLAPHEGRDADWYRKIATGLYGRYPNAL